MDHARGELSERRELVALDEHRAQLRDLLVEPEPLTRSLEDEEGAVGELDCRRRVRREARVVAGQEDHCVTPEHTHRTLDGVIREELGPFDLA